MYATLEGRARPINPNDSQRNRRFQPFPYLRALKPYLARHRGSLARGYFFVIVKAGLALAVPWLLKEGIDSLDSGADVTKLLSYSGLILAATALSAFFLFWMRWTLIGMSRKVEYDLRKDFFGHLVDLSSSFFLRTRTGDLMARATNDLNAVRDVLGPGIMYGLNTSTTVIASIVLMVRLDPVLALASLAPVPLMAYFVSRFAKEMHDRSLLVQDSYGALSNTAQENLAGIRIVQNYVQEDAEIAYFREQSHDYLSKNLSLVKYRSLFTSTTAVLSGIGILILLWLGGSRVIAGHLSIGDLVAFMGYLSLLTWPFIAIGWVISVVQRGEAAMKRMLEIWDEVSDIDSGQAKMATEPGTIRFENVSFRYGDGPLVLDGVDLEIAAGTTTALVGRTASGKSSLIHLLPRLFDPVEGRITIDGIDIRDFELTHLRQAIGFVPQDSFLFSDTLENNLRFGDQEADRERLLEALEMARIRTEVEEFPDGLATKIGERGITLSGGQRQRMSLARALLKSPPILVLDDALSAVDKVTEEQLLKTIRDVRSGRTLILIAHRVSTVRQADQILVLHEGKVMERGSHTELMELGGHYSEMARRQALEEQFERVADEFVGSAAQGASE